MNIFPTILKLQGYPIQAARQQLDEMHSWGISKRLAWVESQQWLIFRHHHQTNPWYRAKCAAAVPEDWTSLPILRKQDFQEGLSQCLSSAYTLKEVYVGNTSGSSGHPFYFAKDKPCHALTWANIMYQYRQHGIELGERQARFYGIPLSGVSRWKELAKDYIGNRVRFPVFDLRDRVLEQWLTRFRRERFVYTYGYTSAMTCFARFCRSRGHVLQQLCPTLRACIVTSETCTPEDRDILQEGFGVPVINEYGASETDVMAFDRPDGQWGICAANVFLEVVDDAGRSLPDGQEGRILVTALHNKAMPIIRYDGGDLGVLGRDQQGLPVLRQLSGRVNDMAVLPSGRKAAGLTFYYISRSLLERGGFLREFIIRQTALDTFVFQIVSDRELLQTETAAIQQQMDLYLEPDLKLIVERVPAIDRSGSGKIKHFYCEIQA